MKKIKRILPLVLLVGIILCPVFGQDTASEYFKKVSEKFSSIKDYEAKIRIYQDNEEMAGTIFYKKPNLLRINFTSPAEQVINIGSDKMTIYIPRYQVILEQSLPKRSQTSLAAMASSQGLNFLRDNYSVSYLSGPGLVPIDNDSGVEMKSKDDPDEKVVKLRLIWRNTTEGFSEIIISFTKDGYLRRMTGKKALSGKYLQFDLVGMKIDQGLGDSKFIYDPPPHANTFKDFLFER